MKKCPYHVYWGQKNGVVVTREPREEGDKPQVVLASNRVSLEKLKQTGMVLLAVLFVFWRVSRAISKAKRRREAKKD